MRTALLKAAASRLHSQCGRWWLLRTLFHPLTALVTTPVRLVQSLANCRVLLDHRHWRDYPHFNAWQAVNSLFYWHRARNLSRFGASGYSPLMGTGNYSMANCCHYCRGALVAFWRAGAATILACMFGWWLTHLVWLTRASPATVAAVMALTLLSTPFYANLFGRQNYNVVGWAFFPLVLFGLHTQHWVLTAAATFGAAFGSLTVVVIAGALACAAALSAWSLWPLAAMIPAAVKGLFHLRPCFAHGNLAQTAQAIAKLIGAHHADVKYRRRRLAPDAASLHLIALLAVAVAAAAWVEHGVPILATMALILVLANAAVIRFADYQSMQMLALSVVAAECLRHPSAWIFVGALPLMTGLPGLVGHTVFRRTFDVFPVVRPFNVEPLLEAVRAWLAPVPAHSRILMAYDDPRGEYGRLFDGYRVLNEPMQYAAGARDIAVMPDWAAVADYNYEGAPDFWGRTPETVREKMDQWSCGYAVIYTTEGNVPDDAWTRAGFRVLTSLDWRALVPIFNGDVPTAAPLPTWWLLTRNTGFSPCQ